MDSEKIINLINEIPDYYCISCGNSVKEYAEILHKTCGNIFKMKPSDFLYNNHRCPKCFKKEIYTEDLIKEKLKEFNEYEFIKLIKEKNKKPSRWKIVLKHKNCGKESTIIVHNFFSNGQRCKECSKQKLGFSGNSKQTEIIENFLINNQIIFTKEKTFKNLIFKKNLRLDFYIEFLNRKIAIEYDGKQHFKTNEHNKIFTKEKLEIQQQRDYIKNLFCKENDIELYRFNYTESDSEILKKLKFIFQSKIPE